jgi:aldehyde:ferredoxin oxidoreductase
MAKSFGWAGKVLQVDLTNEKVSKMPTAAYRPEEFIGGVGLNAKIFWELGCPKVDAFNPSNPLIISVGPLTGI